MVQPDTLHQRELRRLASVNRALGAARAAIDAEYSPALRAWRGAGRWLVRVGILAQGLLGAHVAMNAGMPNLATFSVAAAVALVGMAALWRRLI